VQSCRIAGGAAAAPGWQLCHITFNFDKYRLHLRFRERDQVVAKPPQPRYYGVSLLRPLKSAL
jgi:hypothetical protein